MTEERWVALLSCSKLPNICSSEGIVASPALLTEDFLDGESSQGKAVGPSFERLAKLPPLRTGSDIL